VVTPTVSELLEDRHNAMMVGSASPRALARRVLDLREDPNLQRAICDRARTDAYERFSQARFVQEFGTVYQQVESKEKVELIQLTPESGAILPSAD